MAAVSDRVDVDPEVAWLGGVLTAAVALVAGAVAFPRAVYDRFVWKYFWGPVYADAQGGQCAWLTDGGPTTGFSDGACAGAPTETLAFPGYTVVSEVGYAVIAVVAMVGIALLLRRLAIDRFRALLYGLFPLMVFGGALRVVEDANNRIAGTGAGPVEYPLNTLLISPIIYVTVAAVALVGLLLALRLERTGRVERFEYPLAALGTLATLAALGLLSWMALTTEAVTFYPVVLVVTLVAALGGTAAVWFGVERFRPEINAGTGGLGLLVIVGQAVDGAANVVGLDWYTALTGNPNLVPKHPANRAVVNLTGGVYDRLQPVLDDTLNAVLPLTLELSTLGDAWPFFVLKLAFAVVVVWIFEETVMEDSPRFSIMLLVGAVAVGLGPGTRDLLRATFGV
jgi:uncharacterized membrane protein